MRKPETDQPAEEISGAMQLEEIAQVLKEGPKETTKCCATGTCE